MPESDPGASRHERRRQNQKESERRASAGRTPLPPEERRSQSIKFRVTRREKREVQRQAEELGIGLSSYLRKRALGRPLLPTSLRGVQGALQAVVVELRRLQQIEEGRQAGKGEGRSGADVQSALEHVERILQQVSETSRSINQVSADRQGHHGR
jgi:hypothetical protein